MPTLPPRLLIVDDDIELSAMLATFLRASGFEVELWHQGKGAVSLIERIRPDFVILDVMLPGEDGLSIVKRIAPRWPVLMLSARGEELDRILGLELGADDYLPKPFNPRELLARIKANMRRREALREPSGGTLKFGVFELALDERVLRREGQVVTLTTAEFTLLKIFVSHPRKVLSRDDLVNLAQGDDRVPFDRSVDARVARLRRRLREDPAQPRHIRTVWGSGYVFVPGDER